MKNQILINFEEYQRLSEEVNKLESLVYSIYVEAIDNRIKPIQKLIEKEKSEYIGLLPPKNGNSLDNKKIEKLKKEKIISGMLDNEIQYIEEYKLEDVGDKINEIIDKINEVE